MKITNYFLILAALVLIMSCQNPPKDNNTVFLSGKIENPSTSFVQFVVADVYENIISDTIFLNEDGSFNTSFELSECGSVTFFDGNESSGMYLCPGDSLYLTMDAELFDESIHFEGQGAEKNNFLAEYYLKFSDFNNEEIISFYSIRDTSLSIFIDLVDITGQDAIAFFDQEMAQNEFPPEFISYMQTRIYFNNIGNYIYLFYGKAKDTSEAYRSAREEIAGVIVDAAGYENPDILSQEYQSWLSYNLPLILNFQIRQEFEDVKSGSETYDSIFYGRLQPLISPFEFQLFLAKKVSSLAYSFNLKALDGIMPLVNEYVSDPKLKTEIDKQYKDVQAKLNQGVPEDAILYNLDDEDLLDLTFKDVLDRYKGNVIYLDFWASWCGPCKAEMPNSAALSKKLADEDVVFLYVSTDKDPEAWEKMIRILQLHGNHYRLGANTRKPVSEEFGIKYIPHYVLFDKEGNMVQNNMTRPSDPETEEMIRRLLIAD